MKEVGFLFAHFIVCPRWTAPLMSLTVPAPTRFVIRHLPAYRQTWILV